MNDDDEMEAGHSEKGEKAAAPPTARPRTHAPANDAPDARPSSGSDRDDQQQPREPRARRRDTAANERDDPEMARIQQALSREQLREHPMLTGTQGVQTLLRRQNVLALWTRAYSVQEIASTLGVEVVTVRRDIKELQKELQRDLLPVLGERVNRAIGVRQAVQQEAWALYHRLEDKSHNKVTALTTILQAADAIDKLSGVAAPEAINAAAVAEMQQAVMDALYAVGGQAAQQEFLLRLREGAATARDFYPPDIQQPGQRLESLQDFLPLPADEDEAEVVESDGASNDGE